jgi:predicted MFS family arabinose efflux permease
MFVYPVLLLSFAVVRSVPLSVGVLVGVGWGGMVLYNMTNTLLQTHVADEFRGRVMSIYSMIMFGGMPLGALWAGTVAQFIGAPRTLMLSALVALAFAVLFWVRAPHSTQAIVTSRGLHVACCVLVYFIVQPASLQRRW